MAMMEKPRNQPVKVTQRTYQGHSEWAYLRSREKVKMQIRRHSMTAKL